MDFILMLKAAILGVVEGLTEFLPISSTGHLILTQSLLGLKGEFWDAFEVAIQFGAIIAVIWEFRERIAQLLSGLFKKDPQSIRFALNIIIATLPALIIYKIFKEQINHYFFNPLSVAIAFIVGGLIILAAEKKQVRQTPAVQQLENLSYIDALKVGLAQTLAVAFPGTSRSGATIIGGMFFGLSRQVATHFSFFLAIPILFLAFVKGVWDMRHMSTETLGVAGSNAFLLFAIGFICALISAFICVRWLLKFVSHHSFNGFAWYRIIFGILVLVTWQMGWVSWTV